MKPTVPRPVPRLSRDQWLARALDILAEQGQAKLRIEAISSALGVTRGSFYWHFKDRDEFVRGLGQFWSDRFTDPVIERVNTVQGGGKERLRELLHFVSSGNYARYDVSVRAWAAQEPTLLATIVREVDERRLAYVGSLFVAEGFSAEQADMRARACIGYMTYEAFVLAKCDDRQRSTMLDAFLKVITAR